MSPTVGRNRDNLTPAVIAALALHVGLFAALTIFRPTLPLPLGSAVPINIVSDAPATDSRPAEQAPVTQTAQVDQPVPQAKAPSPAPAPPQTAPTPTPPVKAIQPTPRPALKPVPTPAKPTPVKRNDNSFLDALQSSIARAQRSSPPRPAYAARGQTRAETASVARVDAGEGVSQSDLQGLQQLLERLWNPNCGVEGGDSVVVPIRFSVGDDGRVTGRITDAAHDLPSDAVAYAAARRAIDAVHEAEPYADAYRGKAFTVNFDARKACAGR